METIRVSDDAAPSLLDSLLARAADLFFDRGFGSVTTADVASAAGVSKKTLYRLFPTKEALLLAAVRREMAEFSARLDGIVSSPGASPLAVMREFLRALAGQMARVGNVLASDVRRLPAVWQAIDRLRQEVVLGRLDRLLERMVADGIVRGDIDRRLIMELHVVLIQYLVTPHQIFRLEMAPVAMLEGVIKIVYGGILTGRGRRGLARELVQGKGSA
jgi:AcrR family transcriptional regulator